MKLYYNQKRHYPVKDKETLSSCIKFIEESLTVLDTDKKTLLTTLLLAEETAAELIDNADESASLQVRVKKHMGDVQVSMRARGREYDPYHHNGDASELEEMEDEDVQRATRSILLKAQGERLKFSRKNDENHVRIMAGQSGKAMLIKTAVALVAGIIFGIIMAEFFPERLTAGISKFALTPVKTMFMNALKIIIAPVVFLSIVTCISQFKDIAELGRIGIKVMGMYLLTTVIAVLLAIGVFSIIHPGTPGFALTLSEEAEEVAVNTDVDTSLLSTIVNIVPNNFVRPFLESDTLQLIFLAVICGVAIGAIGEYAVVIQNLFEALNSLFLTITTMIAQFIPLAVFCSVSLIMVSLGGATFLSVLSAAGTQLVTVVCMMTVYGTLVFVLGRLNPFTFFKKNREGMITSFTLCSSSAAMPTNLKTCTDKLGISPKVCNFSIPLGATVNMDGTCIFLTIMGLFLARAYNVNIQPHMLASLALTIILLSLGAPGVPGSAIVCLSVVLDCLGVPIEAIGLIMGIAPIMDMFDTMSNTTGDVAAALIVSRSENLIDIEKFKDKNCA